MMKVADLQQILRGLTQPVRVAGATERVCTELERAALTLEPFRDSTLAEFNDFLVRAEECVRTGKWPKPGRRRNPAPGVPALTVEQAAQRVMGLIERGNEPGQEAALDGELAGVAAMAKPDLLRVIQEVGLNIGSRASKQEIMGAIRNRIRGGAPVGGTPAGQPTPQTQPVA